MAQEHNPDDTIQTLMDVIEALEISPGAQAQLERCLDSLTDRSKMQLASFLTFFYCNTLSTIGLNTCKSKMIYMQQLRSYRL